MLDVKVSSYKVDDALRLLGDGRTVVGTSASGARTQAPATSARLRERVSWGVRPYVSQGAWRVPVTGPLMLRENCMCAARPSQGISGHDFVSPLRRSEAGGRQEGCGGRVGSSGVRALPRLRISFALIRAIGGRSSFLLGAFAVWRGVLRLRPGAAGPEGTTGTRRSQSLSITLSVAPPHRCAPAAHWGPEILSSNP